MLKLKFIPLVWKQVVRHRTRTLLTVGGVATAMFLFAAVQAMQAGVRDATETTAKDTRLIVYRQNRFCPATSRLPEYYGDRIAKVSGVVSVLPMKIVVNNCRTSLDVVTFRGVPEESFVASYAGGLKILEGSIEQWKSRTDAALLGETLAKRRGLRVGERFDAAGVTTFIAGIVRSDEPQDQNVAYVHLPFLQRASGDRKLGVVTQFSVKVDDPKRLDAIAAAIDAEFARDPDPTSTSAEKAFVARAAADVVNLVRFTQYLGWGCLAAVLALVANAIVLSVQDRIKEHAVLQTLGYTSSLIAKLIVAEGLLLGVVGGTMGAAAAIVVTMVGHFSIGADGLSINMTAGSGMLITSLIISAALGVAAGLVPAWQASRREISQCFRAV
ncbi:MAG: putative transport system permease protein [Phycisphaerales bacterium]|jgi:putative ABC transport system permease protein|nr:putative transport system permease protein [Phycisphaerales bacterium]